MRLSPLPVSFYNRSVLEVAPALLGMRLVRLIDRQRVAGYISETEAYAGESDLACHARAGRTPRTEVMYGIPGRAYIYFIYGMHWMLNVVAEPERSPAAILIRAMLPSEGLEIIAARRGKALPKERNQWFRLTNGPAMLCQALDITGKLNDADLTETGDNLFIEPGQPVPADAMIQGPRVGIQGVPEPWRSKPWRYRIDLLKWTMPEQGSEYANVSD